MPDAATLTEPPFPEPPTAPPQGHKPKKYHTPLIILLCFLLAINLELTFQAVPGDDHPLQLQPRHSHRSRHGSKRRCKFYINSPPDPHLAPRDGLCVEPHVPVPDGEDGGESVPVAADRVRDAGRVVVSEGSGVGLGDV
ncbi:hypothetical protein VTN00DRAFT_4481 [Thermoascus crustaceus]|uniref:uncharacterized protein n=1 Tax=Thermoascus crustaceus TaxID=5088 RepID=UPI0037422BA8